MDTPATYRQPARTSTSLPVRSCETMRCAAFVSTVAGTLGAAALAACEIELLALASFGAAATVARLARTRREKREIASLIEFLNGPDILARDGMWTSLEGTRRVRARADDAALRWEVLEPSRGETLASFLRPAWLGPSTADRSEPIERRIARVRSRSRDPRCFRGLPKDFGGSGAELVEAAMIVFEVHREGTLVERRDGDGELVGDTWHPDRDAALRQLASEYGDRLGGWRQESSSFECVAAPRGWHGAPKRHLAL